MRKSILVVFSFLLIAFAAQAGKVRFGIHVDPTIAWMKPDIKEIAFNGMRIGFNYGLSFDYNISDNYAIATGIHISHSGGKISYGGSYPVLPQSFPTDTFPSGTAVIYKLQNLELPIGLKLKTNQVGYITYFAQISFITRFNLTATGDVLTPSSTNDKNQEKIREDIRLFNLGWEVGGGIEYSLGGNTSLLLAAYFNNGFTDITKPKLVDPALDGRVVGNYIDIRVGLLF